MKIAAIFLDADGTIRHSKSGNQFINDPRDVEIYPDVGDGIQRYLQRKSDWFNGVEHPRCIIGIVSNQGGVEAGFLSLATAETISSFTLFGFEKHIKDIKIKGAANPVLFSVVAFFAPYSGVLRKPNIGMAACVENHMLRNRYQIDWDRSIMVGDREEDKGFAENLKIPFMWSNEFFGREQG